MAPWPSLQLPMLLAASVLTFAPLAAAQGSFVSCRFTGSGVAGSVSDIVGVNIAENVTAFICGADLGVITSVNDSAAVVAMEIATATATAIANTTGNCYARGRSRFTLDGLSLANAEAVAIASSVATASIQAEVCGNCSVAAELFAESYTEVFLNATAAAEVTLAGSVNGGEPVERRGSSFVAEYVNATATAFAQILANVRAAVDDGCSGSLLVEVGNELDGVECMVSVVGIADRLEINAESELITEAMAFACNDSDSIVALNATAEAIATAQAIAIAEITQSCTIVGDSRVCAITEAQANATAEAVGSAFAFSYVNATSPCDPAPCEVSAEVLAEAVETVLASASTSALVEQCGGPDDIFNITLLQSQIVEQSLTALSSVLFNVSVIGGVCSIDLDILAAVLRGEVMVNFTREVTNSSDTFTMDMTGDGGMNMTDDDMGMMGGDGGVDDGMGDDDGMDDGMGDGDANGIETGEDGDGDMDMMGDDGDGGNGDGDGGDDGGMGDDMMGDDMMGDGGDGDTGEDPGDDGTGGPQLPTCGAPCVGNRRRCGGQGFPNGPVGCCSASFACVESAASSRIVTCLPQSNIAGGTIVCNPA